MQEDRICYGVLDGWSEVPRIPKIALTYFWPKTKENVFGQIDADMDTKFEKHLIDC